MTTDISYLIDARMIRYLRNRTVNPDAFYWSETLGTHYAAMHAEWSCDEMVETCWQLVTTDDAQHDYLKTHDDRLSAAMIRARIVASEPELFRDSKSGERRQIESNALVTQEPDYVRRYYRHGKQATGTSRRRDTGTSLGRRFHEGPTF